jgi:uncharacterized protein YkwD
MIPRLSRRFIGLLLLMASPIALADEKKEPAKFKMTNEEERLLRLLNQERTKNELPELRPHPLLFKAARGHSENMAKERKMEHELNGKKAENRVDAAGYDWGRVCENIAMAEDGEPPLSEIVKKWMQSKTHRDNILDKKVTETGLGIARNEKGEIYYTQVFARPRGVKK